MEKVQIIRSFRNPDSPSKIRKPKPSAAKGLKDLPPSLQPNLQVVFIGFNPGVASSQTQHHYAHHSNSFWKLFNESRVLFKVLARLGVDPGDPSLAELIVGGKSVAKPHHDKALLKYAIGFTDLVLRCTKTAQELSVQEKLANVPRLVRELASSTPHHIVVVGKGIWEIIIKYIQGVSEVSYAAHFKTFQWGRVADEQVLEWFSAQLQADFEVYVWPNTSGLVAGIKYPAKLAMWNELMASTPCGTQPPSPG